MVSSGFHPSASVSYGHHYVDVSLSDFDVQAVLVGLFAEALAPCSDFVRLRVALKLGGSQPLGRAEEVDAFATGENFSVGASELLDLIPVGHHGRTTPGRGLKFDGVLIFFCRLGCGSRPSSEDVDEMLARAQEVAELWLTAMDRGRAASRPPLPCTTMAKP